MKVEKEYTIYYLVHAISVLDMDLFSQIIRPLAKTVADKIEIAQYLRDFKRIIIDELDFDDTYYEVVHGLCEKEGCTHYSYTFTANYSRINFTLQFEETFDGMLLITDCCCQTNEKKIRFS
ncbi:MAG: hypothetical protein EBS55_07610, partial [Flavobacteriaceae bacterium]|nr:hypothetical protein [Flavobacteriaceae bacterium]